MINLLPSGAFPDSNQRLAVELKPLGKAFAQHAIQLVVDRSTTICLKAPWHYALTTRIQDINSLK